MRNPTPALVLVSALLVACSDTNGNTDTTDSTAGGTGGDSSSNNQAPAPTDPDEQTSETANSARYRLTFEATWSENTHPLDFPSGSPHFSGLIGAVHNEQVIFWERGQIASDGIESMAETGGKTRLREELQRAIDTGTASTVIDGGGIATSPGTVSVEFEVSIDYPQITLVSMLAPSPDWFVGVHNLTLHDGTTFVTSLTRALLLYDAGTDSGSRYTSGDADTQPRETITRLSSDPADTPFMEGTPEVGRFLIEKL